MAERRDIGQRFPMQHDFSDEVLGGRYHLDRRIGCGGMATIYAATDQTTGGVVAVKVLHPEFDQDADLVRRFTQEGQLAAQIQHPNLVAAQDLGWVGGRHFIAMQLVEGERLSDMARDKPLPWERSVRLVLDVLAGLAALHARGVVHRDVSPHNCIIEPLDDGERVRLLDLGNARVIAQTDLALTEVEASESMIIWGTSRYIDPDRLRGGPGDVRADVFSVGALWYTMLTGKALPDPFELEPTAVLDRVPLPRKLLAVLHGALDTRDRRHHSARSMAEAIKSAMQAESVRPRAVRAWWLALAAGLAFPAWLAGVQAAPRCEECATIAVPQADDDGESSVPDEPVKLAARSKPDAAPPPSPPLAVGGIDDPRSAAMAPSPGERSSGTSAAPAARRKRFDLRTELAKCKTHPTARLAVEYQPGGPVKVNGTRPLGGVGHCVEDVFNAHPQRRAVTLTL
jgi:serine/threonine protein kinase